MERFYLRYCSQMRLGLKHIQDGCSDFLGRHPGAECDASLALCIADHSSGPSTWHIIFCWVA